MRIIAFITFITDQLEVAKILKHIGEQTSQDLSTPYFFKSECRISYSAGILNPEEKLFQQSLGLIHEE